jgi:hypothetical protein
MYWVSATRPDMMWRPHDDGNLKKKLQWGDQGFKQEREMKKRTREKPQEL